MNVTTDAEAASGNGLFCTTRHLLRSTFERMAALMEKYQDTSMDLADASLVAVAESRALRQIFTLDSDFRIYRLRDGSMLEVIPR